MTDELDDAMRAAADAAGIPWDMTVQERAEAHRRVMRAIGDDDDPQERPAGTWTSEMRYRPGPEERIEAEVDRERARREARRRLDAEERKQGQTPEILTLAEMLAEPDESVLWRIEQWQPAGSRGILSAQFKGGKTTLVDNLLRSLVDGDPWLGLYPVTPLDGAVAVIDTEMSRLQLRTWLRDQNIRHTDRIVIAPLRGRVGTFNLLDKVVRAQWASWLKDRNVQYPILDCLRPVLDALGLDEHHDAGLFLTAFDALLAEAGIGEALVVHHMGHAGERSRGDSRLRDWPDVEWRLVRQDDNPASQRFISAYGRDVDVSESALVYDPTTRCLAIAGGSRRDVQAQAALDDILAILAGSERAMGTREIQAAAAQSGHPRAVIRAAIKLGEVDGSIRTEHGKRGALLHSVCQRAGVCQECAGTD
jgi:hypothetical protein